MNQTQNTTTQNEAWGFFGTMGQQAADAWPLAISAIADATGCDEDAVQMFLDSSHGRHFADDVLGRDGGLSAAIAAATLRWMSWTIGRHDARHFGIPRGMPYLTGFVETFAILADA